MGGKEESGGQLQQPAQDTLITTTVTRCKQERNELEQDGDNIKVDQEESLDVEKDD